MRQRLLSLMVYVSLLFAVPVFAQATLTAPIEVNRNPVSVAVNPTTNFIFVINYSDDTVSVIDGATQTVTATIEVGKNPVAVAVNPITNVVYVTNESRDTVSVINGTTRNVTA